MGGGGDVGDDGGGGDAGGGGGDGGGAGEGGDGGGGEGSCTHHSVSGLDRCCDHNHNLMPLLSRFTKLARSKTAYNAVPAVVSS